MGRKISILGCGWLGYPLAKHWNQKGHMVKGSSRNRDKLALLEKEGIQPYMLDIEEMADTEKWKKFLETEILVVAIPNKNADAHRHLSKMISGSAVKQVIYTSSTSVYNTSADPVTEKGPLKPDNPLLDIEEAYRSASIPCCILRLSGLVGPDRHPGRFFRRRPDASLANVPVNLIHLEDVIRVFDWLLNHLPCSEIFNIASVEHPGKFDFYTKAYENYNNQPAQFRLSEDRSGYKLISASKLEYTAGWRFSLRSHYPELF